MAAYEVRSTPQCLGQPEVKEAPWPRPTSGQPRRHKEAPPKMAGQPRRHKRSKKHPKMPRQPLTSKKVAEKGISTRNWVRTPKNQNFPGLQGWKEKKKGKE